MKNLIIICEGRTETNYTKNALAEQLLQYNWIVDYVTLPTGKSNHGVHKGGWRRTSGYKHALKEIQRHLLTRKNEIHSTFFDLYGFPIDIPCFEESQSLQCPYEKAKLYERQIKDDVNSLFKNDSNYNPDLFIPYIQPYEFEAFLFVEPHVSAIKLSDELSVSKVLEKELNEISKKFKTPEHINDNPDKAPSKRIEKLVPGFVKNKAGKSGLSWGIAYDVGIQNLRKSCFHFNEWITYLENYNK